MLFDAPSCNQFLSAAILDPETLYQQSDANGSEGKLFPEMLMDLGIVPGVKPHLKVYALPGQGINVDMIITITILFTLHSLVDVLVLFTVCKHLNGSLSF